MARPPTLVARPTTDRDASVQESIPPSAAAEPGASSFLARVATCHVDSCPRSAGQCRSRLSGRVSWALPAGMEVGVGRGAARAGRSAWLGRVAVLGAAVAATGAGAADDLLRWIPADIRVLVQVDPRVAAGQPKARGALGLDPILGRFVTARNAPAEVRRVDLVFLSADGDTSVVAVVHGTGTLAAPFARLRGPQIDSAGGKSIYRAKKERERSLALPASGCIVEGTHPAVRALLQRTVAEARTLAGVPAEHPGRRLLAAPGDRAAVSLVYLAPAGGRDLFAVLQDLDGVLGAEMSAALAPYRKPLEMLGPTQGLRLDLREEAGALVTTLRLLMPNRMAAQIASVSLQAGKDMARAASDAAVRSGNMRRQDALVLDAALESLETQADGDMVRVSVRVPDGVAGGSSR